MNRQHSYVLVEGQQDVFFIGRIFEELGLRSVQRAEEVPDRWQPFINEVDRQRDQAERRAGKPGLQFWQIFKPTCLVSETHVVVIEQVGGNRTKFGKTLLATGSLIEGGLAELRGVGLITDADANPTTSLASSQLALQTAGLQRPDLAGQVVTGSPGTGGSQTRSPNTGVFVMPDGVVVGGLEELLIECATLAYPNLTTAARQYVAAVDVNDVAYTLEDMKEMKTPQGPVKAVVGAISSVLKPGSTIQVSVLRDRWVSPETLATPGVAALVQFLKSLCGLP